MRRGKNRKGKILKGMKGKRREVREREKLTEWKGEERKKEM